MQTAQESAPLMTQPVPQPETGHRLILHGVSWTTYESLLADFQNSNAVHFAYDQGYWKSWHLPRSMKNPTVHFPYLSTSSQANGISVRRLGSTTFTREDLSKGFEPDSCFYIQNIERIRDKEEIDVAVDPPPDLVIEIDITSPSLNKFPIYAAVGVPEVWRYQGGRVQIFQRVGEQYTAVEQSTVLPPLTNTILTQFLEENRTLRSPDWLRRVQDWARQNKR